jgi:hypothetical protein
VAFNDLKNNSVLEPLNARKDPVFAAAFLTFVLRLTVRILVITTSILIPEPLVWGAGNLRLGAGLTEQYTNNSNLSTTNPQSDLISAPYFALAYARQSAKTDANVDFQIRRDVYRRETQQNQTFPTLNAVVNWRIVPERFTWDLQDFASQNRINVEDAPTTDNTQNVNTFITGPNGFFRFGDSKRLELGAHFADSRFEVTNENSTQAVGFGRFFFDLSARSALSLNYDYSSTKFEDPANLDFDRQDFFFQARTQGARSDLVFDAGYTVIDREDALTRNPLFRLSWNRQLTGKSRAGLVAAYMVSNSALNLAVTGGSSPNLVPGGNVANTSDLFTDERLNFFYSNTGRRTTATVTFYARDQNYETSPNDQSGLGAALDINRQITPRLSGSFLASYQKAEFLGQTPTRIDYDTDLGVNFSYRLGRWLVLNAGVTWRNRDSDDPTQNYTETRGIVGITYARSSL